jgi:hypothetical protein
MRTDGNKTPCTSAWAALWLTDTPPGCLGCYQAHGAGAWAHYRSQHPFPSHLLA